MSLLCWLLSMRCGCCSCSELGSVKPDSAGALGSSVERCSSLQMLLNWDAGRSNASFCGFQWWLAFSPPLSRKVMKASKPALLLSPNPEMDPYLS